jgi:K+-transporting ATPase KdpF subunit
MTFLMTLAGVISMFLFFYLLFALLFPEKLP